MDVISTLTGMLLGGGSSGSSGQTFTFSNDGKFQYPKDVIIPTNVTSLPNSAGGFTNHTEVENISFETNSTITSIGASAFSGCTELKAIELPATITSINNSAFRDCSNLVTIEIPSVVTTIGAYAFYNCSSLKNITWGKSSSKVTLSEAAFLGSGVTDDDILTIFNDRSFTISSSIFKDCSALKNIDVRYTWNSMFYSCKNLKSAIVRSTLSSGALGSSAFYNCTALTNVTIKAGDDRDAQMDSGYFSGCTSLKTVIFERQITCSYFTSSSTGNPFYKCTALEDLQIPEGWTESMLLSNGSSNYTNVLTHDSMVAIIANLYDYSNGDAHTLTLGATNLARLSAEEIAVATAKNWTVA